MSTSPPPALCLFHRVTLGMTQHGDSSDWLFHTVVPEVPHVLSGLMARVSSSPTHAPLPGWPTPAEGRLRGVQAQAMTDKAAVNIWAQVFVGRLSFQLAGRVAGVCPALLVRLPTPSKVAVPSASPAAAPECSRQPVTLPALGQCLDVVRSRRCVLGLTNSAVPQGQAGEASGRERAARGRETPQTPQTDGQQPGFPCRPSGTKAARRHPWPGRWLPTTVPRAAESKLREGMEAGWS